MNNQILEKIIGKEFPFKWVNYDYLPDSDGHKKEIYLIKNNDMKNYLIELFFTLFSSIKNTIYIYNASWWDFCLETWNPKLDEYNYELVGKSDETKKYLQMLVDSNIEIGYSGCCRCLDWENFLTNILQCILNQKAPYGPILYEDINELFFYFHHSGSIGIYYHHPNDLINNIFEIAKTKYVIK